MKIAFIGAGKMATAIGKGLMNANGVKWEGAACDPSEKARVNFTRITSIPCFKTIAEALNGADAVLLAVKPQYAAEALTEAAPLLAGKLLISIAAGLSIDKLSIGRASVPQPREATGRGYPAYFTGEETESGDISPKISPNCTGG